jgi:penicillin-binding protein 1A
VLRWILYPVVLIVGLCLFAVALAGLTAVFAYPNLPSLEVLTDYRPKIPLRVYTADGLLIGEFGEERRSFVSISDVPAVMKQAILAAEDERFYQHPGVDTVGVLRAAYSNFVSGGKRQGASTITMQVARNFFLSTEKTLSRKVYEVLLAFKIENNLTKDQILELYINQIFLGQRAYGFAAASQIYFGKPLQSLSTAEAAMLAGLPKAPSTFNPVANPKRAKQRQHYVLRRMNDLGYISDSQLADAQAEPLAIKREFAESPVKAHFVAEMARQIAYEQFHEEAYARGLKVITTITRSEQQAAYAALRRTVLDYDRRHGYRGPESYVEMGQVTSDQDEELEDRLQDSPDIEDMPAAVVLDASSKFVRAYRRGGELIRISGEGLKFVQGMLGDNAPPNRRIRRGAIIRLIRDERGNWQISQLPDVEAAFVAASPSDGTIRALVGGFDFDRNKFNHATQAWRQPGSSFKPFIYSAGIEKGFSPASVFEDAPIVVSAAETGSQVWEPKNYEGRYDGPMSLRTALARSKNMVSIRLLKSIGPKYAQDYVSRFGFQADRHPPYLTMALGAGSVTPWEMVAAYAVFANGGYRIDPYVVKQIIDEKGQILAQAAPGTAGDESLRVIDPRNAYLLDNMMRDVIKRGTATRALSLKRGDLAGKTGTTNDFVDAWFCGYQQSIVAVAWIGFDQPKKLGNGETGGFAALPMWIGFMEKALKGVPEAYMAVPPGLVAIATYDGGRSELIYKEHVPPPPPKEKEDHDEFPSGILPSHPPGEPAGAPQGSPAAPILSPSPG